jgi:transposase
MKQRKTDKQTEPAVDREAVRVLAIELGAREAARRLGIKESTVLSWARRYDWKLPKRKGGAISAIKLHSKPGDALIAAHEELEEATKTALMQTLAKAAQQVAGKPGLDVSNTAQLRDICLAAARIFGWDGKPQTEVNITNQVGVVCDEATRARIIALREKLLAEQASRAAITPPEPQTQLQANVGAANGDPTGVPPDGRPGLPWSMPAGTKAPSDASPVFRSWLEHERAEPET